MTKAAKALDESLKGLGATDGSLADVGDTVSKLTGRADDVAAGTAARSDELQTALVQSQGIKEGIDGLLAWLRDTDNALNLMRPISLSEDTLSDQVRELRVLRADIESHIPSVEAVKKSSADVTKASDPKMAKVIENKLADLDSRFDEVTRKSKQREDDLVAISENLTAFKDKDKDLEDWLIPAFDVLNSSELDTPEFKEKVTQIADDIKSKEEDLERLRKMGRELIQTPKTSDVSPVKDTLTRMEQKLAQP